MRKLPTGTALTTTGRSTDSNWVYVTTSDGASGWVAVNQIVVFNVSNLPVLDNPAQPAVAAQTEVTPTVAMTETVATTATVAPSNPPTATVSADTRPAPGADGRPTARVVADSRINVRSGPGTDYRIIAKAAPNATLVALARNDASTWVQLEVGDTPSGFGWVSADLVEISEAIAELPVSDQVGSPPVPQPTVAPTPTPDAVGAQPAAPSAQTASGQTAAQAAVQTVSNPVVQQTDPTGLSGRLVIQSSWGGTIYVYDLASGALRPLTGGFDPEISPDGSQVVFTREGGDGGIYVINIDGSNEHRIFGEHSELRSPKWSPDGQWIVFSRSDSFYECRNLGFADICMSDQQLFPKPGDNLPPAVKKQIEKIRSKVLKEFDQEQRPDFQIARISASGSDFRDLVALDSARDPDWSQGGIVYSSSGAGIQKTDDKPDAENKLVIFEHNYVDPDWQPGGGRIVFQSKEGSHWEIFGVNPDGSGLASLTRPVTTLVDHLPSNVSAAWSPDGQHIVYLSNRNAKNDAGDWRVWVMNADGSNQHPLPINLPISYNFVGEQMVSWGK